MQHSLLRFRYRCCNVDVHDVSPLTIHAGGCNGLSRCTCAVAGTQDCYLAHATGRTRVARRPVLWDVPRSHRGNEPLRPSGRSYRRRHIQAESQGARRRASEGLEEAQDEEVRRAREDEGRTRALRVSRTLRRTATGVRPGVGDQAGIADVGGRRSGPSTGIARRARVRPEIAHGRARLRCVLCNKVAYHTQDEAEHAAVRIWADRQYPMKVYHKTTCGWWHLAT